MAASPCRCFPAIRSSSGSARAGSAWCTRPSTRSCSESAPSNSSWRIARRTLRRARRSCTKRASWRASAIRTCWRFTAFSSMQEDRRCAPNTSRGLPSASAWPRAPCRPWRSRAWAWIYRARFRPRMPPVWFTAMSRRPTSSATAMTGPCSRISALACSSPRSGARRPLTAPRGRRFSCPRSSSPAGASTRAATFSPWVSCSTTRARRFFRTPPTISPRSSSVSQP